jgi:transcriptional regulator with XRE-family HTH domain
MASRIPSYLRTYRKRCGLTQDEVAFLLGRQSGTKISRFERLARTPSLVTALACQVVFDIPAHELFPLIFAETERAVATRASQLADELRAAPGQHPSGLRRKLTSLKAIAERKGGAPPKDV